MAFHARDELRPDLAHFAGTLGIEPGGMMVLVPQADVEVAAVADGFGCWFGREAGLQITLACRFAHYLACQNDAVGAGQSHGRTATHLELAHAIFRLEGFKPDIGIGQGSRAQLGKGRDAAHGIKGEGAAHSMLSPLSRNSFS